MTSPLEPIQGGAQSELPGFDHHSEELRDRAFDVFADLRSRCPVGHSDQYGGYWVFSAYEHIFAAALNPTVFSSAGGIQIPQFGQRRPMLPIEADPPAHTRYRKLLLPLFAPKRIDALEGRVRQMARELVAELPVGKTVNVSANFAELLPTSVFTRFLGVPPEDGPLFQDWVSRLLYEAPHDQARRRLVADELYDYFAARLGHPRQEPGSVLEALTLTGSGEVKLTEEEKLDLCFFLILAGLDTTTWGIRSSLWYLARHPEAREALSGDPAGIFIAVEEFLRCFSPVPGLCRTITENVAARDQQLRPGDRVLLLWASANRDEAEFDSPDEVLLERQPNRHFAFGVGIHRCLGARLGRLEMRIAIEEMLSRFPDFELADSAAKWHGIGPLELKLGTAREGQ